MMVMNISEQTVHTQIRQVLKVQSDHVVHNSKLQIRGDIEDNSKIFLLLFLNENIYCDPSLELSERDGCNDGSQNRFLWRNMANYP